ncbi:MAG: CAAX prenyl protease-related protein [Phycisphaerales bacterium]|nr:CAAX prenyl protease-related protein [Phycisphaerales bacterium]
MNDSAELDAPQTWLDRQVHARPELPYIAPFMTFLALMAVGQFFEGPQHLPWLYTLRTVGALVVSLIFWKYFPPLGKPHILLSVVLAVVSTAMWIYVHKWFAAQSWYPKTQIMGTDAEPKDYYNCYEQLGRGWALWLFLIVRIGGASIVVPIVEEIFWRGFVLRVLIDSRRFETVPLGMYTLRSFIICSVASALEHPMWEVGILCWLFWNLLFYWKKSLLFMMVMHGLTNFMLYTYVVWKEDWVFWS